MKRVLALLLICFFAVGCAKVDLTCQDESSKYQMRFDKDDKVVWLKESIKMVFDTEEEAKAMYDNAKDNIEEVNKMDGISASISRKGKEVTGHITYDLKKIDAEHMETYDLPTTRQNAITMYEAQGCTCK